MTVLAAGAVAGASMVAMEGVAYAAHRWVMHGAGRRWHDSHHAPVVGRLEANDLFPLGFAAGCVGVCAAGAARGVRPALWVGGGVAAYGASYLFVHDVYIHHRLPSPIRRSAVLERLRRAHAAHHATGGEPYGMLLPLRTSVRPGDDDAPGVDRLDRLDRRPASRRERADRSPATR